MAPERALFNWLIILSLGWAHIDALVMRALDGPTLSVTRGTDIILHCRYELEPGDRLYAVKWFRGRREFYRFRPDLDPPFRLFPVEDVNVDIESSNDERIVIRHVVPGTSGLYRCEVSAEGTFETDSREINITILDTPAGDPVIYNIQSRYAIGDTLDINCTSFESRPAAKLKWFVNSYPKEDGDVTHYPTRWTAPTARQPIFLETSTIGLKIEALRDEHFFDGVLVIVCQADHGERSLKSTRVKALLNHQLQYRPEEGMIASGPSIFDKRRSTEYSIGGGSNNRAARSTLISLFPLFLSVLSSL